MARKGREIMDPVQTGGGDLSEVYFCDERLIIVLDGTEVAVACLDESMKSPFIDGIRIEWFIAGRSDEGFDDQPSSEVDSVGRIGFRKRQLDCVHIDRLTSLRSLFTERMRIWLSTCAVIERICGVEYLIISKGAVIIERSPIIFGYYWSVSTSSDYVCLMAIVSGTGIRGATCSTWAAVLVSILLDNGEVDGGEYATTYNEKSDQDAEQPRCLALGLGTRCGVQVVLFVEIPTTVVPPSTSALLGR
jgi:hypothetical protein